MAQEKQIKNKLTQSDLVKFILLESAQIPLDMVDFGVIKHNLIDPTTKKPYDGIVLEGVFADLNPSSNNNKRIYDIPEYLKLTQILRKQIFGPKGVYGELEHPKGYAVNFNNVSHKIIDIWWDETQLLVMGRVLLLNTPKGKIAQEIVKSGGCLAISGRAAGDEVKQADGTFKATTKVLITYDLVYHPGFNKAVLGFKELNESQKMFQKLGEETKGYSHVLYENQIKDFQEKYNQYLNLNEGAQECYIDWYFNNTLNESQSEHQQQEEVMEENEPSDKDEAQQKLENATEKDLSESGSDIKNSFFEQAEKNQQIFRKRRLGAKTVYDNSAGFMNYSDMQAISSNIGLMQKEKDEQKN